MQKAADLAVENSLRQYGQEYHARQAATVLMDLEGSVRAGGATRHQPVLRYRRHAPAWLVLQSPVYATALQHGFKPTSIVVMRRSVWAIGVRILTAEAMLPDDADAGAHRID
jgi:penicillin-binding protein 1A